VKQTRGLIQCNNNLKQIDLAFKIWSNDGGDKYTTQVPAKWGGSMEAAAAGNVAAIFQSMSNELNTPFILVCPSDKNRHEAADFTTDFSSKNISYFVGIDAAEDNPASIVAGDNHLQVNGSPVRPGVVEIDTNTPIAWTAERHRSTGNIALADGSAAQATSPGLVNAVLNQRQFDYRGPTNRFNRFVFP